MWWCLVGVTCLESWLSMCPTKVSLTLARDCLRGTEDRCVQMTQTYQFDGQHQRKWRRHERHFTIVSPR